MIPFVFADHAQLLGRKLGQPSQDVLKGQVIIVVDGEHRDLHPDAARWGCRRLLATHQAEQGARNGTRVLGGLGTGLVRSPDGIDHAAREQHSYAKARQQDLLGDNTCWLQVDLGQLDLLKPGQPEFQLDHAPRGRTLLASIHAAFLSAHLGSFRFAFPYGIRNAKSAVAARAAAVCGGPVSVLEWLAWRKDRQGMA
jgi:hypothetical protein